MNSHLTGDDTEIKTPAGVDVWPSTFFTPAPDGIECQFHVPAVLLPEKNYGVSSLEALGE